MKNICSVCEGKLKTEKITYTQEIRGKFFIVENVTAQVCPYCGEQYLSPETVEVIRELIESKSKPVKTQEVPVYYYLKKRIFLQFSNPTIHSCLT